MAILPCTEDALACAEKLLKTCRSRDPVRLCEALHIHLVIRQDLKVQRAASALVLRQGVIILNGHESEENRRILILHEIGHLLMHRAYYRNSQAWILRHPLFQVTDQLEYEANLFAARFLIDPVQMEEMMREGYANAQIAAAFSVPVEMVEILQTACMRLGRMETSSRGLLPQPSSDFLGKPAPGTPWDEADVP